MKDEMRASMPPKGYLKNVYSVGGGKYQLASGAKSIMGAKVPIQLRVIAWNPRTNGGRLVAKILISIFNEDPTTAQKYISAE